LTKNQDKSEALAIYHVISQIPHGRVAGYGDVAKMAGLPGYARYVGYLLKSVPIDTSLPWHRVVRSDGTIPQRTIVKQKPKLMAEKVVLKDQKVSQALFWNSGD
jgi:methylated-DNA-protein-cysteine methyltransferase-like protein